jgi:hypothetical protein
MYSEHGISHTLDISLIKITYWRQFRDSLGTVMITYIKIIDYNDNSLD